MKVNWYRTKYRKQTCGTYNTCQSSNCGSYSCNCSSQTLWRCIAGDEPCVGQSAQNPWVSNKSACANCPSGMLESKVVQGSCQTCYYSCANSACGCKSWNTATIVSSCSANSSTKCTAFKCYWDKIDDQGNAC